MIKILGDVCGIICSFILVLNFLSYFLKDLYMKIYNLEVKKKINAILPLLSKHNYYLPLIFFICFFVHISCLYIYVPKLTIDIFFLILLILIISKNFTMLEKSAYDYLRKFSSYAIIFFLVFHILKSI